MSRETGYFVDESRRIVGPSGPTGLELNADGYLVRDGKTIGVYIEDGLFYRCEPMLVFFKSCSQTGHRITSENQIIGPARKLPWLGR